MKSGLVGYAAFDLQEATLRHQEIHESGEGRRFTGGCPKLLQDCRLPLGNGPKRMQDVLLESSLAPRDV